MVSFIYILIYLINMAMMSNKGSTVSHKIILCFLSEQKTHINKKKWSVDNFNNHKYGIDKWNVSRFKNNSKRILLATSLKNLN